MTPDPTASTTPSSSGTAEPRHAVAVHYHEIGLKGRNRGFFENRLVRNLGSATDGCARGEIRSVGGRILIDVPRAASEALLAAIGRVFGVAVYAPCEIVPAEIPAMHAAAMRLLEGRAFSTFAIAARRATRDIPLSSQDINVQLGAAVQTSTGAGVNLDEPDATVHVDVVGHRAYVYVDRIPGPGGLPVGVSGKLLSMLSGGIDSPVATMRMLKRGASVTAVHFHSAPFTDLSSARKAEELAERIALRQGTTTLHLVAFGEAQQRIVMGAPPPLRVVLYRRFMVRIAEAIAREEGAKALVTGDSLGQVASQTLENMLCVEDAATMPILRPLVGTDKQEIVDEAKRYGTYELSVLPFEDCCSLFVPRSPATRATVEECRLAEEDLDVDDIVASCVRGAEVRRVERPACAEEDGWHG